ncbi:deoxyribodipyrimidine photo-lyase [Pseudoalteromonas citrea]|uniref:Deoxyribodipyrimidine photo-lyase n=2 Tax=Pseudoalteromonas citrea TaxID=43655 RepID=A0AAD4AES4_9GAMM|nr:deoxyribodipyrimidine photo-lyase [Pseudoalteromonas citrea]KAF7764594.1 deoxyribodipyrimidine photo-lyase [Pseudoalteromonas citrea]
MKSIFWFRRDLRYFGNEALIEATKNGANMALFFVCEKQWRVEHGVAPIQIDLIKRRIDYLGQKLAQVGIELRIISVDMYADIPAKLDAFCKSYQVDYVYANTEYEINEVARDTACMSLGVKLRLFDGDVIAKPGSVLTKSQEMFKVFTPFKKAWLKLFEQTQFIVPSWPLDQQGKLTTVWCKPDSLIGDDSSCKWPVDDESLARIASRFVIEKCAKYHAERDIPGIKGTSGLSPYLAIGAISVKQLIAEVQCHFPDILQTPSKDEFTWINELIWREFYRHLIVAYPNLCKYRNFNSKYDTVVWNDNEELFSAWCRGDTGYPIVDAAMRQLNQTGWMHNRLRMIVASFLTKHLLIDWRKGERYFMEKLIDGDFASNSGGWQWAASTGCDAQPYFRIFNPVTQSKKFDPEGNFIRTYVPELADIPSKYIHFPHDYIASFSSSNYSPAIVEHKEARQRALDAFKV